MAEVQSQSKKKTKGKQIILTLVVLVAVVISLTALGNRVENPWPLSTTFQNEAAYEQTDKAGFVIDQERGRITFLNGNGEVVKTSVISYDQGQSQAAVRGVIANDAIYIHQATFYSDTIFLSNERIEKYSLNGEKISTVYRIDYDALKDEVSSLRISTLDASDSGVYVGVTSPDRESITLYDVQQSETKEVATCNLPTEVGNVFKSDYSPAARKLAVATASGSAVVYGTSINPLDDMSISDAKSVQYVYVNDDGTVVIAQQTPESWLESAPFSAGLIAYTYAVWASRLFIFVLAAVLVIKAILAAVKEGKAQGLRRFVVVSVAIAAMGGIAFFYSNILYSQSVDNRAASLSTQAHIITDSPDNYLANELAKKDEPGYFASESYETLTKYLNDISRQNAVNGANVYTTILSIDQSDGETQRWFSSEDGECQPNSVVVSYQQADLSKLKDDAAISSSGLLVCTAGIYDDNDNLIGVCVLSSMSRLLAENQSQFAQQLFMVLLAVGVFLFLLFREASETRACLKRRKELLAEHFEHAEYALARPIKFLTGINLAFDISLMPLIAKDMLTPLGLADNAALLGLPPTVQCGGYALGILVYQFASSRINVRPLALICTIAGTAFSLLSGFAVAQNAFVMYLVMRGLSTVLMGCLNSYASALPLRSKTFDERASISRALEVTTISGGALGGIVAGYLAQYLGNWSVYMISLFPGVLLIPIAFMLPKGVKFVSEKTKGKKKTQSVGLGKIILQPSILALIVCALFAMTLANGYKSFLFPLFMADTGLTKVTISNLIVFADVAVFAMSPLLNEFSEHFDNWYLCIWSLVLSALAYLSFMLNTSLVWAVLVLVILGVLYRFGKPASSLLWPRVCKAMNAPEESMNNAYLLIDRAFCTVRSPILGGFLGYGQAMACLIVAAICGVSSVLFTAITARSPMRPKDEGQPVGEDTQASLPGANASAQE